jgi:diacylglycerol kinase family enzyme
MTNRASDLVDKLKAGKTKEVDIGRMSYQNKEGKPETSYFINVADAGMGPEVVRKVLDSDRLFGSSVAYYMAILSTFSSYTPMTVSVKGDDWEWAGKLNSLAVCNGNFYGDGLCVGPDAVIDDGIFSTFIGGDASKLDFILQSAKLKKGKKIIHPKVLYNQTRQIQLTSEEPCMIEADGEWFGYLPATIDLIPKKINVLC